MVKPRFRTSIAVLTAATITVSACSSSKNNDSAGTSTGDRAASASANTGGGVDAARAATQKNLEAPTTIPLTTPLKSKPEPGKTFVWVKCDIDQCQDQADGLKDAAAAIGWNYKEIGYKSADPATLVSALKQALQFKPVAVALSAQPRAVWQSVIPEYKAAGVPIVTGFLGQTLYDDTVIGQVGGPKDISQNGKIIGNWVAADSNGKAKILVETVNDFPIVRDFSTGFGDTIKKNCPDCKITEINNTIPQVLGGQVVQTVVAAVQKDPSIDYVVTSDGPFITGLPSALAAAGLTKVKIAGETGDVENLTAVKTGKEPAFTGVALHYSGWLMIDIVLRHMQGMDYEKDGDGGLPTQLLTNDVNFQVQNSYDKPADYADQIKKLWLVR
jgi:ribose transport system substrate-binding protein